MYNSVAQWPRLRYLSHPQEYNARIIMYSRDKTRILTLGDIIS